MTTSQSRPPAAIPTAVAGERQAACAHCAGRAKEGITLDPGRRRFLKTLAFGTGAAALATTGFLGSQTALGQSAGHYTRPEPVATLGERRLVVIELPGGNDGLSTLVPYGMPAYYDLRRLTAIDAAEVLDVDGTVGLHPNLARLHAHGVGIVQGVGSRVPDLSHFASFDRMWRGDVDGTAPSMRTGFLGRICDQVAADEIVTGVTLGWGPTPALVSERAHTIALPDPELGEVFSSDEPYFRRIRAGLRDMSSVPTGADADHEWLPMAGRGLGEALAFADLLEQLPPPSDVYGPTPEEEQNMLKVQLAVAGRLLAAQGGPRILHVPMDADFDTHDEHGGRYHGYMARLDEALDAFLLDLAARGLDGATLVVTTSEFGRRPGEDGSDGLDHGSASVALLAGPVNPGLYGEHPSLTQLDMDDNLVASVGYDSYYATIAERWMGIPADEILPDAPVLIDGLIA